jgi:hypothetical protein
MAQRLGNFIIFLVLSLITFGIYTLFFYVTRTQENIDLQRRQVELLEMAILAQKKD